MYICIYQIAMMHPLNILQFYVSYTPNKAEFIPVVRCCYNRPKNVEAALEQGNGQRLEEFGGSC